MRRLARTAFSGGGRRPSTFANVKRYWKPRRTAGAREGLFTRDERPRAGPRLSRRIWMRGGPDTAQGVVTCTCFSVFLRCAIVACDQLCYFVAVKNPQQDFSLDSNLHSRIGSGRSHNVSSPQTTILCSERTFAPP